MDIAHKIDWIRWDRGISFTATGETIHISIGAKHGQVKQLPGDGRVSQARGGQAQDEPGLVAQSIESQDSPELA
jgi:hypothetical protein